MRLMPLEFYPVDYITVDCSNFKGCY